MSKILTVLKNTALVDELLKEIDTEAAKESHYEYGLPLFDENASARLREIVYKWLVKVESAEQTSEPA